MLKTNATRAFPTRTRLEMRGHGVLQRSPWAGGFHEPLRFYSVEFCNPSIAHTYVMSLGSIYVLPHTVISMNAFILSSIQVQSSTGYKNM